MIRKLWIFAILLALLAAGCGTHQVKVQPIKVEPVQLTLDVNVKVQQEQIESAASALSPVIDQAAPDFTLLDHNQQPVKLSKLGGKWIVLYFYPKDDTPGCTIEARDFTRFLPQFQQMNAQVLGISMDSPKSHCDFIEKHELGVRLLSDPDHKVMELYGAWVSSSLGNLKYGRVIRTTMIVDPAGIIRHYWPEVIAQGHAERVLLKVADLQGRKLKS